MNTIIDVNQTVIVGTVTGDVSLKTTKVGKNFLIFRVTTTSAYTNQSGEVHEKSMRHSVILWNHGRALQLASLGDGNRVLVRGNLENRKYEDNQGVEKWVTQINATMVVWLDQQPETCLLYTSPSPRDS